MVRLLHFISVPLLLRHVRPHLGTATTAPPTGMLAVLNKCLQNLPILNNNKNNNNNNNSLDRKLRDMAQKLVSLSGNLLTYAMDIFGGGCLDDGRNVLINCLNVSLIWLITGF